MVSQMQEVVLPRTTPAARSAWWCCYGFLVDDIVGTGTGPEGDKAAAAHCHWVRGPHGANRPQC
jgi:hypothetical protein